MNKKISLKSFATKNLLRFSLSFVIMVMFLASVSSVSAAEVINYFYDNGKFVVKTIGDDNSHDGDAITILSSLWDEMNGHGYLKWDNYWEYTIYKDAGLSTQILPVNRTGYIDGAGAVMEWGHVALPECGNGVAEGSEECDDGNSVDGDGCENDCTLTWSPFGSISHMWGVGHGSNPSDTILIKWNNGQAGENEFNGQTVTLKGSDWDDLNDGFYYLKYAGPSSGLGGSDKYYYLMYTNHNGNVFSGLVTSSDPSFPGGYLSSAVNGYFLEGHVSAPTVPGFGTIMNVWADPDDGGCDIGDSGVCLKWFKSGHDAPDYNGLRVTLVDSIWEELNGQWHIKSQANDERIKLYANYDGSTFSDPAQPNEGRSGYLDESDTGYFIIEEVWVDTTYDETSCAADGRVWQYDCFDLIQEGVDAVAEGGTVNVTAGTYNEDVTIDKDVTLNGAQAGVDARGRSASESEIVGVVVVTSDASDVTIDGFKFTSPTRAFTPRGFNLHVESESSTVRNNIFVAEENAGHTYSGYLDFGGITNTLIEKNDFSGHLDPTQEPNVIMLGISGAGTVTVSNNEMHDVGGGGGIGIMSTNAGAVITIENNEMDNTGDGIWVANWVGETVSRFASLTITGNNIYNNAKKGIKFVYPFPENPPVEIHNNNIHDNTGEGVYNDGAGLTVDAESNWWGDATGPGGVGGGAGDDVSDNVDYSPFCTVSDCSATSNIIVGADGFSTIQAAIDAASSGDTINVTAGIYDESILIDKGLTLQGAGKADTVIDADGVQYGIKIAADDVTVKDLTVKNADHTNIIFYHVTVSNPRIENVDSLNAGTSGIESQTSTVNNLVINNVLSSGNIHGLRFDSRTTINGATITNSHFDGNTNGLVVYSRETNSAYSDNVTISGSTFNNNDEFGLYIGWGNYYGKGANWQISDSEFKDNGVTDDGRGIFIDSAIISNWDITDSVFDGVNQIGILVVATYVSPLISGLNVQRNTFTNNTAAIVMRGDVGSVSGFVANNNNIAGNTDGVVNYAPFTIDAIENYWGAVNPDFHNITSGDVEYSPWYIDEAMTTLNEEVTSCNPGDIDTDTSGTDVGACQVGINIRTCNTDGSWGDWEVAQVEIVPIAEICNGDDDDDCDGYADSVDADCLLGTDYYTITQLEDGQLDNQYYTETESDDSFATITGLATAVFDMATKTWVSLGFITNSVSNLVNYYTQAEVDTEIDADVLVETNARIVADTNLQTQIDGNDVDIGALQTDLGTETTNRIADVGDEETRATIAEEALSGRLNTLEADPTTKTYVDNADVNLQDQINDNTNNITSLEERAPQNTDGIDIYLTQGWNTFKLPWFVLNGTAQVHGLDVVDYNVTTVLADLDFEYLAYYDGTDWRVYAPNEIEDDFIEFPTAATSEDYDFHIYMDEGARLTIPIGNGE